jgi:hypothetical protein
MDLYYRPNLQSPQAQSSLLLKNKSKINGKTISASMDKELHLKLNSEISFNNIQRNKNYSFVSTKASTKRGPLT